MFNSTVEFSCSECILGHVSLVVGEKVLCEILG